MNILIAGANGYLGKHLSAAFSDHNIITLTRNDNIATVLSSTFPDIIINTVCSYGRNGETISEIYESNFFVGLRLLEEAKRLDKHITFINCGTSLEKETNLYSISKTHLIEFGKFISNEKLKFINMNLQHFFGPGANNNFVTFVIENCLKNNTIPLSEGKQKRDFIFIDDVVNAFKSVVYNLDNLNQFENIDVGQGNPIQLKELIYTIKNITKSSSILEFGAVPTRPNEADEMKADVSKLKSLGWQPKTSVEKGLKLVVDYYNEG